MACTDKLRNGMTPIKYAEAEYTMVQIKTFVNDS